MTEFVPGVIIATTTLYAGVATLALLVTIVWRFRITEEAAGLSPSGFADALRDRVVVGICVLLALRFVAAVVGLPPLAEVTTVAGLFFVAAAAQREAMRTVAYYSGPRGEPA